VRAISCLLVAAQCLAAGQASPPTAPDGHSYTPPVTVRRTPIAHPQEINPGRPPAAVRDTGDAGKIIGGVAGAAGVIGLAEWLHARNQPMNKLSRDGPKVPDQFSMSGLTIGAFCQGSWPVALDYVLDNGGVLLVTVETAGFAPFNYRIQNTGRRGIETFRLPAEFPRNPAPGMYTIRAMRSGAGPASPVYLRLFGVAGGARAVGSVAIDEVRFGPQSIRPKQHQEASYAFHAHTDFDRVRAEFLKAVLAQGQLASVLEDHADIDGVLRETTSTRLWNGKHATPGEHILQVRAWESALNQANWVIAWSADQVLVEE